MGIRRLLLWLLLISHSGFAANTIHVHCQGQGPEAYLIGGGPAFTTWHLDPVVQALADRYRVCHWDMRGVGDNADLAIVDKQTVLSQWLADMEHVLPKRPVILWGHSWGALQVMLFANQHPQRVSTLILSNPVDPALLSLEQIELKRFHHAQVTQRLDLDDIGTPAESLHQFRSKIASYFVDADKGWAYAEQFDRSDSNSALNVQLWEEYRRQPLTDQQVRSLAPKIAGILYCRHDVLQPEALAEYRRLLPSTDHRVIEGCAHFPWVENPGEYYRQLKDLLRD